MDEASEARYWRKILNYTSSTLDVLRGDPILVHSTFTFVPQATRAFRSFYASHVYIYIYVQACNAYECTEKNHSSYYKLPL